MGAAVLMTDIKSKEERFEETALVHMDSIYRSALYMTKNETDAQDLVQDTYLRAFKFFDSFEEGTNCRAWLLKILRNTFINSIRRGKRQLHVVSLTEMSEYGIELSSDFTPEDGVFGDLFNDEIVTAMNKIPAEYRSAILLADVERLPYKEVADIMDCPIGTVMSRLHRGRKLLRENLQNYAVQYGYAESRGI